LDKNPTSGGKPALENNNRPNDIAFALFIKNRLVHPQRFLIKKWVETKRKEKKVANKPINENM